MLKSLSGLWGGSLQNHLLAYILNKKLSDFIKGSIDQDQIHTDFSKSQWAVRDVQLNDDYLNQLFSQFDIPLVAQSGVIGSLSIQITQPWSFSSRLICAVDHVRGLFHVREGASSHDLQQSFASLAEELSDFSSDPDQGTSTASQQEPDDNSMNPASKGYFDRAVTQLLHRIFLDFSNVKLSFALENDTFLELHAGNIAYGISSDHQDPSYKLTWSTVDVHLRSVASHRKQNSTNTHGANHNPTPSAANPSANPQHDPDSDSDSLSDNSSQALAMSMAVSDLRDAGVSSSSASLDSSQDSQVNSPSNYLSLHGPLYSIDDIQHHEQPPPPTSAPFLAETSATRILSSRDPFAPLSSESAALSVASSRIMSLHKFSLVFSSTSLVSELDACRVLLLPNFLPLLTNLLQSLSKFSTKSESSSTNKALASSFTLRHFALSIPFACDCSMTEQFRIISQFWDPDFLNSNSAFSDPAIYFSFDGLSLSADHLSVQNAQISYHKAHGVRANLFRWRDTHGEPFLELSSLKCRVAPFHFILDLAILDLINPAWPENLSAFSFPETSAQSAPAEPSNATTFLFPRVSIDIRVPFKKDPSLNRVSPLSISVVNFKASSTRLSWGEFFISLSNERLLTCNPVDIMHYDISTRKLSLGHFDAKVPKLFLSYLYMWTDDLLSLISRLSKPASLNAASTGATHPVNKSDIFHISIDSLKASFVSDNESLVITCGRIGIEQNMGHLVIEVESKNGPSIELLTEISHFPLMSCLPHYTVQIRLDSRNNIDTVFVTLKGLNIICCDAHLHHLLRIASAIATPPETFDDVTVSRQKVVVSISNTYLFLTPQNDTAALFVPVEDVSATIDSLLDPTALPAYQHKNFDALGSAGLCLCDNLAAALNHTGPRISAASAINATFERDRHIAADTVTGNRLLHLSNASIHYQEETGKSIPKATISLEKVESSLAADSITAVSSILELFKPPETNTHSNIHSESPSAPQFQDLLASLDMSAFASSRQTRSLNEQVDLIHDDIPSSNFQSHREPKITVLEPCYLKKDYWQSRSPISLAVDKSRTTALRISIRVTSATISLFDGFDLETTRSKIRAFQSKVKSRAERKPDPLSGPFLAVEQSRNSSHQSLLRGKKPSILIKVIDAFIKHDVHDESSSLLSWSSVSVNDLVIEDHIPTSSWRFFLARLDPSEGGAVKSGHDRFLRISIGRTRAPSTAEELLLQVTLLPIRLRVDQDALDFFKSFGSYEEATMGETKAPSDFPFFKKVEIFPVKLRLDYKPKRVDYSALSRGDMSEMMNFFHFDGSEMVLRHLVLQGIAGTAKLSELMQGVWSPDVKANQLTDVIGGISPLRSLISIGSGIANLVLLPVNQYREDAQGAPATHAEAVRQATLEALSDGQALSMGTRLIFEQTNVVLGGGAVHEPIPAEILNPGSNHPASLPYDINDLVRMSAQGSGQTILAVPFNVNEHENGQGQEPSSSSVRILPVALLQPGEQK